MEQTLQLLAATDHAAQASAAGVLAVANDADVSHIALDGISRIDLHFPSFADGRAFSQAFLLRRRRGYTGEIRATGDVLIDQLVQMQRTGFSSAVLRADQDLVHAARQFARYARYYQGDAVTVQPRFKEAACA
jgi:uncharacterized protein (DUF934 family)